ncbi:hypothetical protein FB192DRAFT_1406032 [Mucor lusitanicus]|uniref:Uncharacterized protein n=1 Tax=Mucor circinelloides f. lusitanicus TaxID=29924 RepID=A0A8H4EVY9_MUCCL|nr:hypothetical protein FB192DRAFT_1406032 [Mucor lusitanicus]
MSSSHFHRRRSFFVWAIRASFLCVCVRGDQCWKMISLFSRVLYILALFSTRFCFFPLIHFFQHFTVPSNRYTSSSLFL